MLRGVLCLAVVFTLTAAPVLGQGAVAELNGNIAA